MAQIYKDAGKKRNFEVVLVSYDDNDKAGAKYMTKSKMEWPGVKVSEVENIKELTKIGPSEFIPHAVLMTPEGKLVENKVPKVMAKLKELSKS